MRFDDMLATVMAQPQADAVACHIKWRQLIDILADVRTAHAPIARQRAFALLGELKAKIAPVVRASVARAVAPRVTAPALVNYFAQDDPAIAAPVLRQAHLSVDQWCALIPTMPSASRALLRERRDLPTGVETALNSYGHADFALEAPPGDPESAKPAPGLTPIADIVARIEAFKQRRAAIPEQNAALVAQFDFETDDAGSVIFVTQQPREPIIGINIAAASEGWLCGVDGHAAGAFRAHNQFRGARLRIAGNSPVSGDWVIDGDPIFEPQRGAFLGYRGSARRPLPHERAEPPASVKTSHDTENESLRQLVHELRSPLNAIQGFAEMMDRQMLGPLDESYRTRARAILHEGERLLRAIEDVDTAAQLEAVPARVHVDTIVDAAALLTRVSREFVELTNTRHVHLRITRAAETMPVRVDSPALHRLFARLLGCVLGMAVEGETLEVTLERDGLLVRCAIGRPRCLVGLEEAQLTDPSYGPNGDWPDAPLLGLGFGLRLIANLARTLNVKFHIGDTAFVLILPSAQDSATERERTHHRHVDHRIAPRPTTTD